MYKIYCENTLICDSTIEETAVLEPKIELEENTCGSFEFIVPSSHPYYELLKKKRTLIQVFRDNETEPTFSGDIIETEADFYNQLTVFCEGDLSYLNDTVQRQAVYHDITVRQYIEQLIANHNSQVEERKRFTVGAVTVTDNNDSLYRYTNMNSTLEELKEDILDDLGGIVRVRHANGTRYLDILADSPNTNGQPIRLGENLLDFTSNLDSTDIVTAIIPQGARLEEEYEVEGLDKYLDITSVNDGNDYVYSADAVETYGWIYRVVSWNNVTDASTLKNKAEAYLSDIQFDNLTIEAKAVDLHLIDSNMEQFKVSDNIRVISKPHGLNKLFRLTKITINLNKPENDTVTLGKSEINSLSVQNHEANSDILNKLEDISVSKMLQSAKNNATALITNAMGGYVYKTRSELYIMDSENPETAQKVWRWNINGLGYSSTGINGEYGLAMTIDGAIVADFITVGTLSANRIKSGTLTLGGLDNVNGQMVVKDASGKTIGSWNKDGINIPKGTISGAAINGGTITGSSLVGVSGSFSGHLQVEGSISATSTIHGDNNMTVGGEINCGSLYSNGAISGATVTERSDRRLKQDIEDIDINMANTFIDNLKPKSYSLKEFPDEKRLGFIAQDVQKILSEYGYDESLFVKNTLDSDGNSYLALNYIDLIPILWAEVKRLKDKVENREE